MSLYVCLGTPDTPVQDGPLINSTFALMFIYLLRSSSSSFWKPIWKFKANNYVPSNGDILKTNSSVLFPLPNTTSHPTPSSSLSCTVGGERSLPPPTAPCLIRSNSTEVRLPPSWVPSINSWRNTVAASPLGHESFMLGRAVRGATTCFCCSFFASPQSAMSSLCHYSDWAVNGCADSCHDTCLMNPQGQTQTVAISYLPTNPTNYT